MAETVSTNGKPTPAVLGAAPWLENAALSEAPSDDKALFAVDVPTPLRTPARKPAPSDGKPPEYTAVYRLYGGAGELLYVGMSNAPLERFIEHRDAKAWWPDVETYSIEWFMTRSEAENAEAAAIKDEWPVHNIAHQPRANGPFVIPSYLVERLVSEMRSAMECSDGDTPGDKIRHAEHLFRMCFDPEILPNSEIWFAESDAPDERTCQNVDEVVKALGSFRPPISSSTRAAPAAFSVSTTTSPVDGDPQGVNDGATSGSASVDPALALPPSDLVKAELARRLVVGRSGAKPDSRIIRKVTNDVMEHPWLQVHPVDAPEHEVALNLLKVVADEKQAQIDSEQADAPF